MVDFVKIVINSIPLANHIKTNPLWVENVGKGEPYFRWKNLTAKVYDSGRIVIQGSLHICTQNGNWGDFTRLDLWDCIEELREALGMVMAEKLKLHTLEIGVNLRVGFDPSAFLARVIAHGNHHFEYVKTNEKNTGKGIQAKYDRYWVKIYDKGRKSKQQDFMLRFEIHVSKMAFLKKEQIATLADLQRIEKLEQLGRILREEWQRVIVIEDLDETKLTKTEQKHFQQIQKIGKVTMHRQARYDLMKNYEAILQKYEVVQFKETVGQAIFKKWDLLLDKPKNTYVCTDPKNLHLPCLCREGKRKKNGSDLGRPPKLKIGKFLTAKMLEADSELLRELQQEKPRKQYNVERKESEAEAAAHGLRNDCYNKGNNNRKRISKLKENYQAAFLFDQMPHIAPEILATLKRFEGTPYEIKPF